MKRLIVESFLFIRVDRVVNWIKVLGKFIEIGRLYGKDIWP